MPVQRPLGARDGVDGRGEHAYDEHGNYIGPAYEEETAEAVAPEAAADDTAAAEGETPAG